nr:MAG TPA: hypothetical protein [Caudoviricetes sp.]
MVLLRLSDCQIISLKIRKPFCLPPSFSSLISFKLRFTPALLSCIYIPARWGRNSLNVILRTNTTGGLFQNRKNHLYINHCFVATV